MIFQSIQEFFFFICCVRTDNRKDESIEEVSKKRFIELNERKFPGHKYEWGPMREWETATNRLPIAVTTPHGIRIDMVNRAAPPSPYPPS